MADVILVLVILTIVGLAAFYVIRAKKRGQKCIGCPNGCNCGKVNGGCSGCSTEEANN